MLNIHTHLLDLIKQKKITTDEFIILLLIAKRVNKKNQCFPSIKLLQEESTFGRDKVQKCIVDLDKKGFIKKSQRKVEGKFSSNFYTIKTNLIGVYINCQNEELEEEPTTGIQGSEIQATENQTLSINQSSLSINQSIEDKKKKKFDAEIYLKNLDLENSIKTLLFDWLEIRKAKKTPTTQKAIDLAVKTLNKHDIPTQIQMLENSILNGWTGIFEAKKPNFNQKEEWKPRKSDVNIFTNEGYSEVIYV